MSLRELRPLLAVALLGVVLAVAETTDGLGGASLSLLPALLLFAPLLMGRYVGERTLRRIAVRLARPRRRRTTAAPVAPRPRPRRTLAHGGALLAARLAGRAPPRTLLVR